MNSTPLISIIIPAYDCGEFISDTLKSIRSQTLSDWECIVVDDGSKDQTSEVVKGHAQADSRIRLVVQQNSGHAAARNRGFGMSNPGSKYVTFMDGDDIWIADALETLVSGIEKDQKMIGAHGLAEYIDQNGNLFEPGVFSAFGRARIGFDEKGKIKHWNDLSPTSFPMLLLKNTVFPPGIVLTKRFYYEQAGQFDPAMGMVDDWDMLIRLSRYGHFRFVDKVVAHYRRHVGNTSMQSEEKSQRAFRALRRKTFFSTENSEEQKDLLRRSWRTLQIIYVKGKLKTAIAKFAEGSFAVAAKTLLGTGVQVYSYLRGCPTGGAPSNSQLR